MNHNILRQTTRALLTLLKSIIRLTYLLFNCQVVNKYYNKFIKY